jgi:hypothetical protein
LEVGFECGVVGGKVVGFGVSVIEGEGITGWKPVPREENYGLEARATGRESRAGSPCHRKRNHGLEARATGRGITGWKPVPQEEESRAGSPCHPKKTPDLGPRCAHILLAPLGGIAYPERWVQSGIPCSVRI